jgi:hypothetical protein
MGDVESVPKNDMKHRTIRSVLIFALFAPCAVPATPLPQSTQPEPTPVHQGAPEATSGTHPIDADSLVVPDGTPLEIKLVIGFSSASAKVGDDIYFSVVFPVQANGIVVIPQGTKLTAKVVSVSRPRRGARNGKVLISYEGLNLPTGETATVRETSRPGHKAKQAAEAAAQAPGEAATLFITAGIPLLALPFEKGEDQVVPEGTLGAVALNGPLRVSRKAAMQLQPTSGSAHVSIRIEDNLRELFCGQKSLGGFRANELLRLELNPGTYWLSTSRRKDPLARVDVLANRDYYVVRDKHAWSVSESPSSKQFWVSGLSLTDWDLTKLTPDEYRSLAAQPAMKGNESRVQNH